MKTPAWLRREMPSRSKCTERPPSLGTEIRSGPQAASRPRTSRVSWPIRAGLAGGPEGVGVLLEEAAQGLLDDAVEQGAGGGAGLEVGGERAQADAQAVEVDVEAGEVGGDAGCRA
jgi:hypothetical protein